MSGGPRRGALVPLSQNFGSVLSVIAQPRGSMDSLELAVPALDGSKAIFEVYGTHQGYDTGNPKLKVTVCLSQDELGEGEPEPAGEGAAEPKAPSPVREVVIEDVPVELTGSSFKARFELDLLQDGLLRPRSAWVKVKPNISPSKEMTSQNKVSIADFGYHFEVRRPEVPDAEAEKDYEIGSLLRFDFSTFGGFSAHARLRFEELDEGEEASSAPPSEEVVAATVGLSWAEGEPGERVWRVACVEAPEEESELAAIEAKQPFEGDSAILFGIDPGERGPHYFYKGILELSADQKSWTKVEEVGPFRVKHPSLESFALDPATVPGEVHASGKIKGLHRGFPFPLELSLWVAQEKEEDGPFTVERVGDFVPTHVGPDGSFGATLLHYRESEGDPHWRRIRDGIRFAVLTVPPRLTGSGRYLPVRALLGQSLPRLDASVFAPRAGGTPQTDPSLSAGAVGVASAEEKLTGRALLSEHALPRFQRFSCDLMGMDLVFRCDLRGEVDFWEGAKPCFVIRDADGKETEVEAARAPAEEGDLLERLVGKLDMGESAVLNKEVVLTARTKAAAKLFGEVEIPPFDAEDSLPLSCALRIGPVSFEGGLIRCPTHYFPTLVPGNAYGKALSVRIERDGSRYTPQKLVYTFPSKNQAGGYNKDGMIAPTGGLEGVFEARLEDEVDPSSLRISVYRHYSAETSQGKVANAFTTQAKTKVAIVVPTAVWPPE